MPNVSRTWVNTHSGQKKTGHFTKCTYEQQKDKVKLIHVDSSLNWINDRWKTNMNQSIRDIKRSSFLGDLAKQSQNIAFWIVYFRLEKTTEVTTTITLLRFQADWM